MLVDKWLLHAIPQRPGYLVDDLRAELDRSLRPDDALDERNREIHVLEVLDEEASELKSWSTSGMY